MPSCMNKPLFVFFKRLLGKALLLLLLISNHYLNDTSAHCIMMGIISFNHGNLK